MQIHTSKNGKPSDLKVKHLLLTEMHQDKYIM